MEVVKYCGWHVLRSWDKSDFDFKVLLRKLHVDYGVNPFFKISVEPNPRSSNKSSIVITPAGLGLPDKSYYSSPLNDDIQIAYKLLIRDVVMSLGATKNDAEKFGTDMFHYEQRIADIMPESIDLLNPVYTYNPLKISELPATLCDLQFMISNMFPSTYIDENTEVIVKCSDYLQKVEHLLSTTVDEVKNSYMMWTLVMKYLPYLSSQYTSTLDNFHNVLYGISNPPQRWEFCAKLVQEFMPAAVDILLEKQNPITDKTKNIVTNVFANIKEVVKKRINQYKNIPDLYMQLTKKLAGITLQIGLPDASKNETLTDYNKLMVLKANLFATFRNGVGFLKKMEETKLSKNATDNYIIALAVRQPFKVQYLASRNVVVVPRAVLAAPWFEQGFPSPIIYGRLGVEIAQAIVSSVLPYDSAWTADMKLLSSYHLSVNESIRLVGEPMRCLGQFILKNKLSFIDNVNLTNLHTYKRLSAIKIALEALQLTLKGDDHIHQPSLEIYEDSALFYISQAQSLCTITTKEQGRYDHLVSFQLAEQNMFEVIWMQDKSFSDSIQCRIPSTSQCSDIF